MTLSYVTYSLETFISTFISKISLFKTLYKIHSLFYFILFYFKRLHCCKLEIKYLHQTYFFYQYSYLHELKCAKCKT